MKKLLGFLALLFALPAWCATYYVDCAASGDSGAGTSPATAWKTIGRINGGSFSPGDSILFKRGCTWREPLWPPSSGASGNPITFGAYGTGANPVISGADLVTGWTNYSGNVWQASVTAQLSWDRDIFINDTHGDYKTSIGALVNEYDWYWASNVLYLYAPSDPDTRYTNPGVEVRTRQYGMNTNQSYLIFDGITVEKSWQSCFSLTGSNSIVRNCVGQYGSEGLFMSGGASNNEAHDNIFQGNHETGIAGNRNVKSCKFYRNEIYQNGKVIMLSGSGYTSGIKFWDDSPYTNEGNEIYENYVHNNTVGIWIDAVQPPTNPFLIHHNWIENNAGPGVMVEISSKTQVWGNVIWKCGTTNPGEYEAWTWAGVLISGRLDRSTSNNLVYNNTIVGCNIGINVWQDSYNITTMRMDNNIVKNNIVLNSITRPLSVGRGGDNVTYGSGNVYEYNCFGPESSSFIRWGNSYKSTYGAWEAAYGGFTYSVQADPQLTNPAAGDFTLQETSRCIDAGADVGPSYGTALLPGSLWPSNVLLGNQYRNGQRWEIGAYLLPAPAPPPGSPTPTPTPIGPTPTPVPSGPPVPTGVSASNGTFSDRIRVTWNASAGATGNWIYRNTAASPPATGIAWVNSPGYDDFTAVPGQTYWYWVRAGNVYGWSTYSAYDTGFRATGPVPTPTATPRPGSLAASFTFSPETPTQGQQVQFKDASSGASTWDWDFGDGSRAPVRNPMHTYAVRGTYTVVLWVGNGVNWSQAVKTVTVVPLVRKHLPRV